MAITTDDIKIRASQIAEQAADPNVSVALFTTGSDSDRRADAVNRLESYVTLGPKFVGWLWGDQPQGSRQLLIFMPVSVDTPKVNDVLCLFNNKDTANEYYQYVRLTAVEAEEREFTLNDRAIRRKVLTVDIGDPLQVSFAGVEMHSNDAEETSIYTTTVSDAASYFGVMKPTAEISSGDTTIMVDDIYTQLVPTSQAETAVTDQVPGEATPVEQSGENMSYEFSGFSGTTLHLYSAFVPGTLVLVLAGVEYSDQGNGVLMQGSNQAGTIDYGVGTITFISSRSGNGYATFDPGVSMSLTGTTLPVPVPVTGQGYTYVGIMWPLPTPNTITVDYLVNGNWYRLRDDGAGFLVPDLAGTGTGKVNYETGQMQLTCAAIPDADSAVLLRWGVPTEIIKLAGGVDIEIDPVSVTLAEAPVKPGSVSISWPAGVSSTATATDNGSGVITGDASGWIVYGTGELYFTPASVPVADSDFTINYEQYPGEVETPSGTTFTLANAPRPGTLALDVTLNVNGRTHTYTMRDNGNGAMYAEGFTVVLSQCRASLEDSLEYVTSSKKGSSGNTFTQEDTEKTITFSAGPISGTVDYVTGDVVLDLTTAISSTYTLATEAKSATKGDTDPVDIDSIYVTIGG
ncbi:MAG: hypothetical protein CSA20_08505 [Deltaproteobacteria bacterium]|nr:MAG: hypothetical protein CSA20_08505 [Deltaproteobacteria bacterium]